MENGQQQSPSILALQAHVATMYDQNDSVEVYQKFYELVEAVPQNEYEYVDDVAVEIATYVLSIYILINTACVDIQYYYYYYCDF